MTRALAGKELQKTRLASRGIKRSPWEHSEEFEITCTEKPALKVQGEVREATLVLVGPVYSHSRGQAVAPPWVSGCGSVVACHHVPVSAPAYSGVKGPASESSLELGGGQSGREGTAEATGCGHGGRGA